MPTWLTLDGSPVRTTPPAPSVPTTPYKVGLGDTVQSIARTHNVKPTTLLRANPQMTQATPMVGEILNIPAPDGYEEERPLFNRQPSPLTLDGERAEGATITPGQTTDCAVADLRTAETNQAAVAGTRNAAERDYMRDTVPQAKAGLKEAVGNEIEAGFAADTRTGSLQNAAAIRERGTAIAARYEGNPAAQAAVREATEGYIVDRQVNDTVALLESGGKGGITPKGGAEAFQATLKTLPPDVQTRVLSDPRVDAWVKAPLAGTDPLNERQADNDARSADEFAARLALVTGGLAPEQAQALGRRMLPEIDRTAKIGGTSDVPADERFRNLSRVVESFGGDPAAQPLIYDVARSVSGMTGYDQYQAGIDAIAQGHATLGVEICNIYAAEGATGGPRLAGPPLLEGLKVGFDAQLQQADNSVNAYSEHYRDFNAVVNSGSGLAGEEEARQKYLDQKGPEFRNTAATLQSQVEQDGAALTKSLLALDRISPEAMKITTLDETMRIVPQSPGSAAIMAAANKNPGELAGPEGKALLDFFQNVKVDKEALGGFASFVTGLSRANAISLAASGDAAALEEARGLYELYGGPKYAEMMGMDAKAYQELNDLLLQTLVEGQDPAAVQRNIAASQSKIDRLGDRVADGGDLGKYFTGLNLLAGATLLSNSTVKATDSGNAKDWVSFAGDTFGLTKDVAELLVPELTEAQMRDPAFASQALRANVLGKFTLITGALSVGMDFTNAVIELTQGNGQAAAGNLAVGVGGTAILISSFFPPAGMLVAIGAGIILITGGEITKSDAERKAEIDRLTSTTAEYLKGIPGLDEQARVQLSRRFGDSGEVSAMPVINAYLSNKGMTEQQKLDWVNTMAANGKLDAIVSRAGGLAAEKGPASFDMAGYDRAFADKIASELDPLTR